MALSSGTRIGVYEIVALVGAGGMGEVYRARDTKLGRDVALKVLLPTLTADAGRVARFGREARLLASLNHQHIGAIYGFEDTGHVPALVLELVEGDTLDTRVRRGPLPVREALGIALQIADALDAAHGATIVHRDLKPSNIKITPDGVVKVLDFGLAKALEVERPATDLAKSTVTSAGTMEGVILGTAAYMSPEQARGLPVDKRTDIWAFGCVLFEMLTGSPAFARETVTDTIAAVVTGDPQWTSLPAETPGSIRRLLTRCLEKDSRRRLHDIADARIEIEDAMTTPAERPREVSRRWSRLALAALLLGIATAVVLLWVARGRLRTPAERALPDTRVVRLTDLPGLEESPAISPDGKSVAFTAGLGGKRQLFVRLVAGGAPLQITRDPADHEYPAGRPTRAPSSIFRRQCQESSRGTSWKSRRWAVCHGALSTAWAVPTSGRRMGGSHSSGWRRNTFNS